MPDCLSEVTGSIPYEPQIVEWCNGSISDSESDDIGSNPISITNVGSGLTGKVSHCECEEQGLSPGVNQNKKMACSSMVRAGTLYVQG